MYVLECGHSQDYTGEHFIGDSVYCLDCETERIITYSGAIARPGNSGIGNGRRRRVSVFRNG